jgi:dTDP-4-dehydrorhamnose reductase
MMQVLVIGKTGQLARALKRRADVKDFDGLFIGRDTLDLTESPDRIKSCLQNYLKTTDVIIVAAAYTSVDEAEDDETTAEIVNAVAPAIIAAEAAKHGLPIIFISTDYVFKGNGSIPYRPTDATAPLNAYGRSKASGERAVLAANPKTIILRTSWVYDGQGRNFLTTMLGLAEHQNELRVVNDQIGRPTYAGDLAAACISAAHAASAGQKGATGIFHVTNVGEPISWADFAHAIFELSDSIKTLSTTVTPVSSDVYKTLVRRPGYSVLDLSDFEETFSVSLPHWRDGLVRALVDAGHKEKHGDDVNYGKTV